MDEWMDGWTDREERVSHLMKWRLPSITPPSLTPLGADGNSEVTL